MFREVKIAKNKKITKDIYLLKIRGEFKVKPGQFFMIKKENSSMTLYRPISVFECDEKELGFLYLVKGRGTQVLKELRKGDVLSIHGPYGNGFPEAKGKLCLIGGGIGMAPLYLCALNNPKAKLYIGLREDLYNDEEIQNIKNLFRNVDTHIKIGGTVIDDVRFDKYDTVFTCGPSVMMKIIGERHSNVYVSLEKHMGCAVGACLSCSCKTSEGMKKVCKDGPVFSAKEVDWE